MTFDEQEVEKMLRSMFFMGAMHGSFLVSKSAWTFENIKKHEDECVKFLMWRHKLKQRGR